MIQVNNNSYDIGKRIDVDYAVIADAKSYLQALIDTGESRPKDAWLEANQENKHNWISGSIAWLMTTVMV